MTTEPPSWAKPTVLAFPDWVQRRAMSEMTRIRERDTDSMNDIYSLFRLTTNVIAEGISNYVISEYGPVVQSGLFAGMKYLDRSSGSLLAPKILGTYEQELSFVIDALADCDRFLDIGCAEGYFAVGAAWRYPDLAVTAYDTNPAARSKCAEMAELNAVAERVAIGETCTPAMITAANGPGTIAMIDIEGAEIELIRSLDPVAVADTRFIVETHRVPGHRVPGHRVPGANSTVPACSSTVIIDHMSATHDIEIIHQAPRDPRPFAALQQLGQLERHLALWEGRDAHPWLWITPKNQV